MSHPSLLNTIILDNISDAIVTIDAKGIIHTMNSTVEDMFGYSTSELIGANVNILMNAPYHELHDSYISNYLRTGQTKVIGQSRELEAQRKNGEIFEIELFVHDIGVDEEHRFLGIIRDISERKHMDRVKSEFVSTVSHELRTPLTSIKGALGMINSGVLGLLPDKAKRMVELAHNNTERLILLVNDLLDMEKIQAGKIDLKMEKVNLTALVKESIAMNQTYASNLKVKLILEESPADYFVEADYSRMLQVMANLISNAAKYSPADDVVKITVKSDETTIQVSVTDNGLGIPPEYHSKIFQKFSQLDASDKRQKGGTGLGLNITKAIVEHHGGRIDFVTQVNKGATFFFTLPAWQPTPNSEYAAAIKADSNSFLPRKNTAGHVLVLEDEPDIAKLLALMLEHQNFSVTTCGTAKQAKQLLATQKFSLMTVDIRLPDQDGLSLVRELRGNPDTHQLPIIIVSAEAGLAQKNNVTAGLRVIDWIEKPIDQQRLLNSVHSSLKISDRPSKILYVEDDADLTQMMETLLGDTMTVVSADTLCKAKRLLKEENFDLVILDVGLPDGTGLEILPLLKEQLSLIPVIIFSGENITAEVVNRVDAALIKSQVNNDELVKTIKKLLKAL
jgi:PAS domain S-box-containing protein